MECQSIIILLKIRKFLLSISLSKELALPVIDFYAATDAAWGNNVGGSCADGIHMNSANEQAVLS